MLSRYNLMMNGPVKYQRVKTYGYSQQWTNILEKDEGEQVNLHSRKGRKQMN